MNKQLFLMMGAPGSGKSTWAKKQLNEYKDAYVSRDEIRFRKLQPGDDYFAHENEVFDEFVDTIRENLMNNYKERVFADASHLNVASRAKLINRIRQRDIETQRTSLLFVDINVVWLKTDLNTCLARNSLREGRANVPEATIKSMWKSQQMPRASEGISKVYIVEDGLGYMKIVILDGTDENNFKL